MTEAYPWGAQSPVKRVSALEAQIKANESKKEAAVKRHREEVRVLDETDRGLRADLRTAQVVVERERSEANASAASSILLKVLKATGVDVEEAIRTGSFESVMAEALSKVAPGKSRKPKTVVPPAASAAPPSDQSQSSDVGGSGDAS
jgi:hypothetical protein